MDWKFLPCLLLALVTSALGEPWTPAATNVVAWYDASETNTITANGGVVTEWYDRSTNNFWTLTTGNGPTTGTRTINELNVIDFDGTSSIGLGYDHSVKVSSAQFSVFMVTAIDDADNAADAIWSYHKESANGFNLSAKDTSFSGRVSGPGNLLDEDLTGGPYEGGTNIFCIEFNKTATDLYVYVDGINRAYASDYGAGAGFRHIYVYRAWNGTYEKPDGAVGEMILTEDISAETRERMEGYLAHKWGLAGNLPSDHTYRYRIPWVGVRGTVLIFR